MHLVWWFLVSSQLYLYGTASPRHLTVRGAMTSPLVSSRYYLQKSRERLQRALDNHEAPCHWLFSTMRFERCFSLVCLMLETWGSTKVMFCSRVVDASNNAKTTAFGWNFQMNLKCTTNFIWPLNVWVDVSNTVECFSTFCASSCSLKWSWTAKFRASVWSRNGPINFLVSTTIGIQQLSSSCVSHFEIMRPRHHCKAWNKWPMGLKVGCSKDWKSNRKE